VSQRGVQSVIGRLITDGAFRRRFEERAGDCLVGLGKRGVDLNKKEIAALLETDPRLWSRMAILIDRRLLKVSPPSQREAQSNHKPLTERQHHVLRGIFEGLTNKEIGADLGVSESAVKATVQLLFRAMRVRTRAQLVSVAIEDSLFAPGSRVRARANCDESAAIDESAAMKERESL
jgi:DNA-binding CsgD family transcriptional regulator